MGIKLLMGGSPCTHWSIAQTKDRETEPSGIGWELFLNYRIARDKYKPDYFLYENNKPMSPAIKAQITRELGVEPVLINSALVSAQSRQRLYWVGKRNADGTYSRVDVEQPEDRGILLRDVLKSGVCWREKAYTIDSNYYKTMGQQGFDTQSGRRKMVAEPVNITADGKAQCLRATYYKDGIRNLVANTVDRKTCVAEPVRIGTIESTAKNADFDSQQYRVYSLDGKSVTLCGNGGGVGAKTGLYATPVRIGDMPTKSEKITGSQNARIYSQDAKAPTLTARPNGGGVDGLLYAMKVRDEYIITNRIPAKGEKQYPVYHVQDGLITVKARQYPIKLADGYYIIRKLTVTECKRLQTVPEGYIFPVSDTQAYKMLGNGWTVDVIAHILSHIPDITTEPVEALSMYDGMSCGHIALDKLGADVEHYYATEIDKYAIKTTMENYPDTVQLGDAFQVREDGWRIKAENGGDTL